MNIYIEFCYLAASILFVFGLKGLTHPDSARRGMLLAAAGMTAAIVGTLFNPEIVTREWIWIGLLIGGSIGAVMSIWMPMTAMPERTALSHAFGALAAALVGIAEYANHGPQMGTLKVGALGFEILLGCITFTGSLIAFGKLYGVVKGTPITFKGQNI
ncbi:MAG: NAD synthetase, partial [Acidobacteria bacterium]